MKEIKRITGFRIISEPGDTTRYDYIIHRDGDYFCITPYESTFTFPQKLNYFDIKDITNVYEVERYITENIKLLYVNPYTLLEVIRTIKDMFNNPEKYM
jgi:hypothetical protein